MNWKTLNLNNIPSDSGVYAFKDGKNWLYIGRAKSLAQRLNKQHFPLQIAKECFHKASLVYQLSGDYRRLENELLAKHSPDWNGFTSHGRNGAGIYTKYPCCDIKLLLTPEEQNELRVGCRKAVSVIGF